MTLINLMKSPYPYPGGHQQARERLWCSPHCIQPSANTAMTMHMWEDEE